MIFFSNYETVPICNSKSTINNFLHIYIYGPFTRPHKVWLLASTFIVTRLLGTFEKGLLRKGDEHVISYSPLVFPLEPGHYLSPPRDSLACRGAITAD